MAVSLTFEAVSEREPGPRWQSLFQRHWDAYQRWFLAEGDAARPTYGKSVRAMREHMPELVPVYEQLCDLAGGGDVAARFLSLYCPPPYLSGCSQAVWPGEVSFLVRNYDYSPKLIDAVFLHTEWQGRKVLSSCDCLWGVLDGINDAGLAVSLTFGGRRVVGEGFGVPLVLRYVLQTCETAGDAVKVLCRIPIHMAYNVTVLDREGRFNTLFLSPDRLPVVRQVPVTTNHQGRVEWHRHARATATLERERFLFHRLADSYESPDNFVSAFMRAPLYSVDYDRGFGTLYTAVYHPDDRSAEYRWPGIVWRHSINHFQEGRRHIEFAGVPYGMPPATVG
jgi:predicted choloylglycine hydrolase